MSPITCFRGSWILHLSIVLSEEAVYHHYHAFCVDHTAFLFFRLCSFRLLQSPWLQSSSGCLSHQAMLFPSCSFYIKVSLWICLCKVPSDQYRFCLNPMLTHSWAPSLRYPEISLHIIWYPVYYTLRQKRTCRYFDSHLLVFFLFLFQC